MNPSFSHSVAPGLLLPLLIWFTIDGCSFYSTQRPVTVKLPELPAQWLVLPEPRAFHLSYRQDGVTVAVALSPGTATVELPLNKGTFVPILAYPVFGTQEVSLLPAGAVFPCGAAEDGGLLLDWLNGPSAQVLITLLDCDIDIDRINVPRLLAELPARTGGNPWNADLAGIVRHFAEGAFRADWIRPAALSEVVLQLPSTLGALPGIRLLTENALAPDLLLAAAAADDTEDRSTVSFGKLGQGMHRFVVEHSESSASDVRLDLEVKPDGRIEWFSASFE